MMTDMIDKKRKFLVMRMVCNIEIGVPSTRAEKSNWYW